MQRVTRGTKVLFDRPIEVRLARNPNRHRVLGVIRDKNPNGLRGLFSYAIAEWYLAGKWRRVRDLVQQMRLANAVAHDLGHNGEDYANVDGDESLGEMQVDYRIIYYKPNGKAYYRYPVGSEDDTPEALSEQLDELVETGHATGGDIEQYVDTIGWCIQTPEEDEA